MSVHVPAEEFYSNPN